MKRITIENNEAYLRLTSKEVDFTRDNYPSYINKLQDFCKKNAVYALAPIQIGIPKRIIYIRNSSSNMQNNQNTNYNENIIYINPKIIKEEGHTEFLEGCASCIKHKNNQTIYYVGIIDRPYKIEIEYYDLEGKHCSKTIEGFEATVFSHEYDHLDGILHIDKTNKVLTMTLEEMKEYRRIHPYKIISKN